MSGRLQDEVSQDAAANAMGKAGQTTAIALRMPLR